MTNAPFDFSMPYSPTGVNIYGGALATSAAEEFRPPQWKRLNLPGLPKNVVCTEVRITHLNSGWDQDGDLIAPSTGTAYLPYGRHMLLPMKITEQSLNEGFSSVIHWTHFGSDRTLVMGGGATNGEVFFKETSSTNPALVALTSYNPAATEQVVSISAIVINSGSSTAERWVAGKDSSTAAEVFNDVANPPTSAGAMHANTANLWGVFRSNINASTPGLGTNILYADAEVYTLADSAAVNGAPTQVLSGIPSGGAVMGVEQLQKNWPVRAWLWWPLQSSATLAAAALPGQVVSINLEGTDPQPVPTTLDSVRVAALWNRTVVMTDYKRIVAYDGETERDLHFLKNREQDSDYTWGVRSLIVRGGDLYAWVLRTSQTGGSNSQHIEVYLPDKDAWVPVSGTLTNGGGTDGKPLPVSQQTGFLHMSTLSNKFERMFMPPSGVNPFYHYVQTGADAEQSQVWATSATVTTNKFPIPGLSKWPSMIMPPRTAQTVVYEIDATEMNLAAGGSDCQVKIEVANQDGTSHNFTNPVSATFLGGDPIDQLVKRLYGNTSSFTKCQLKWTLTQGATTTKTMNALPLTVRFMTFLDGNVVLPSTHLSKVKP